MLHALPGPLHIRAAALRPAARRLQLTCVAARKPAEETGADKPRKPRRRAVKDAAAADAAAAADQLHAESLHRLHGTSDNLRALLERRAERQQRAPRPAPGAAAAASPRPLPARAAPAELAAEAAPQRRAARVRFCLNFHVDFGQRVCLVGGSPELGAWVLADAVPLEWGDGDQWHAAVDLPAGSVVEYKYVVVGTGGHAAAWQAGNNSVLALRHADDEVEVYDNWGGNPGAQVVAAGAAPVTRESRLLAWASEVEALMSSQRQELRRARMEVVAAQEEALAAREEAARARQALAASEAARVAAAGELRQAAAMNGLLQAQLVETTSSFLQAIDTAVGLLGGGGGGKPAAAPKRAAAAANAEAAAAAAAPAVAATAPAAAPAAEDGAPGSSGVSPPTRGLAGGLRR